jgi:hypothetical protein
MFSSVQLQRDISSKAMPSTPNQLQRHGTLQAEPRREQGHAAHEVSRRFTMKAIKPSEPARATNRAIVISSQWWGEP